MQSRNFRYTDTDFKSYGKVKDTPPAAVPEKKPPAAAALPVSFDKLKNLTKDDYILLFLIFMLIKDNENPDWPLIASLGYILFDFKD